jgi:hypothetical protein
MTAKENQPAPSCFVVMPFGGIWDEYFAQIHLPAVPQAALLAARQLGLST